MSTTDRYCVYKPKTSCPECGNPVILDGPLLSLDCPSCFHMLQLSSATWKSLLEDALTEYNSRGWDEGQNSTMFIEGYQIEMLSGRQRPKCPVCRTDFPVDTIGDDHDGPLFCGECGKRSSSHLAPDWLREILPADRLYCAATAEDPDGAQELAVPNADKPVMMACMACGAGLGITTESPRITTCSYCQAENFLPDPLWRRLHPVKKRVPWYVRYGQ